MILIVDRILSSDLPGAMKMALIFHSISIGQSNCIPEQQIENMEPSVKSHVFTWQDSAVANANPCPSGLVSICTLKPKTTRVKKHVHCWDGCMNAVWESTAIRNKRSTCISRPR